MLLSRALRISSIVLVFSAASSWSITGPTGPLRPDTLSDLAPHAKLSDTYNEFWTYLFWLNNGMQVEVNLSHAYFGSLKDPVCGASLSLTNFRGHNFLVAREYKNSNFTFDAARSRLTVHERIFFEGRPPEAHRLSFATEKKGVSYFLELTFKNMTHGAVWGDGVFHLQDGQQSGLFFHIPKAEVWGRLAINGDTLAVEGFGWMDHSWQTHFGTKLISAGYRYVLPSNHVEGGFFFRRDGTLFGYGLRGENGHLTLLRPTAIKTLEPMSWAGIDQPHAFELDFDGPAPAVCRWKEQRQWSSAFGELNTFERFGAKVFLGGDLYGFRGTGAVNEFPALFSFTIVKR